VVESGPSDEVILRPAHPYTQLLASAAPDPGSPRTVTSGGMRALRGGQQPSTTDTGCLFRDRCPAAMDVCRSPVPEFGVAAGHMARCWLRQP
jgi:peptide/nickel transport system ATP-binding protein